MVARCWPTVLAAVLVAGVSGGRVISRFGLRRAAPKAESGDGGEAFAPETWKLVEALSRLRNGPGGTEAVREVVGRIEKVRDGPRDRNAKRLCLWDPDLRALFADERTGADTLDALKAAGFDGLIHERGGAPFLVMRRARPLLLRQLAAAAAEQLSLAEAEGGPDGGDGEAASARADGPASRAVVKVGKRKGGRGR